MASEIKGEHDRRERSRTKVNWRGKLMTARGSFDCRVLDLSPGGALVRLIAALDVEEPVTLFFSEAERIEGVVAWTQSRYVGIRFAKRRDKRAKAESGARCADESLHGRICECAPRASLPRQRGDGRL